MISRKNIIIVLILFVIESFATGWNDYEIKIDENYSIVRSSSNNIYLYYKNYKVIKNDKSGPISEYNITNEYIFLKKNRLYQRNKFEGDTYQMVDYKKSIFYIINKKDNSYLSFTNKKLFTKKTEERVNTEIEWLYSSNPNPNHPIPWIFYIFYFIFDYGLYLSTFIFTLVTFKYYKSRKITSMWIFLLYLYSILFLIASLVLFIYN
jgi:hypothetical protein